jgi:hypothetical protein
MNQQNLVGRWIGEGIETELDINSVVSITPLKVVLEFKRINDDCYKFIQTFFFLDGSINYGPVSSLVNTNGQNKFIFADSFGIGIDSIEYDSINMDFLYNINGAIPDNIQPYISLNGVYNLKKDVC